jgi:predicted RNA methylase
MSSNSSPRIVSPFQAIDAAVELPPRTIEPQQQQQPQQPQQPQQQQPFEESKSEEDIVDVNLSMKSRTFPKPPPTRRGEPICMSDLVMTRESLYSASRNHASAFLCTLIERYMGTRDITVTDGTANVGSDTIQMALWFTRVNAVDISRAHTEALLHNVNVYKLKNVKMFNDDSLVRMAQLKQDVLYFDPPWGGPEYKNATSMPLSLSNIDLADVFQLAIEHARLVVFKVPLNFAMENFTTAMGSGVTVQMRPYKTNYGDTKFIFLLCSAHTL